MKVPQDIQPGNSSSGVSATGGPTFKPQNPSPDKSATSVYDGSDAALSSAVEYDCAPFGRDYEPLPIFVRDRNKAPTEGAADDYLDTYRSFGRGNQPLDTDD